MSGTWQAYWAWTCFTSFIFEKANLWWFWDQIMIKPRTSENRRYHKKGLAVRSVNTITHERSIWIGSSFRPTGWIARSAPWGSSLIPEALYATTQFSHDRDKPSISQYEIRRADWSQSSRCRCHRPGNAIPEYSNAVYNRSRWHTISSNSRTKQFESEWQFFLG